MKYFVGFIGLVASVIEIASFVTSDSSYLVENTKNAYQYVSSYYVKIINPGEGISSSNSETYINDEATPSKTRLARICIEYEVQKVGQSCSSRPTAAQRIKCRITIPSTEPVCKRYGTIKLDNTRKQ